MKSLSLDRIVLVMSVLLVVLVGVVAWWNSRAAPVIGTNGPQIIFSRVSEAGQTHLFLLPFSASGNSAASDSEAGDLATASAAPVEPIQLTDASLNVWSYEDAPGDAGIALTALAEDGTADVLRLNPTTQERQSLVDCDAAFCGVDAFSPDARLLAYSRRSAEQAGASTFSPPRLWLLDIESGETLPVFADSQTLSFGARWSPDGESISYVSPNPVGVGVYNLQTGNGQFYETSTGEAAIWHPQRNEVLYSESGQSGDYFVVHLILANPATGERTNLSLVDNPGVEGLDATPVEDNLPAFSPDSEWIAFRRKAFAGPNATRTKQLWLMRADGTDARPLTNDDEVDYGPPQWSPDGRYLLYHRFPIRGPDITLSIWLLDVESGEQHQLVEVGQRPIWLTN